ncbi:MAG: protein-L-isoaspartate(D-aspartate) O-methyltransferase [Candidatus Hydrothermarchaeales archaeon]
MTVMWLKKSAVLLFILVFLYPGLAQQNKPGIIVLANSIDFALAPEFFEFLGNKGMEAIHVTVDEFEEYTGEKFIVILGGPDAYEGVGSIVRQVLSKEEQSFLRTRGNKGKYIKTNHWVQGQVVFVIAGSGRDLTQVTHLENKERLRKKIIDVTNMEGEDSSSRKAREYMVKHHLEARDITDAKVLAVLGKVQRQRFVSEHLQKNVYNDNPLPIAEGQTISQPYVVALMTQSLKLNGTEKVLEIGTGSGYQAAILAEIANEVYTIEIREQLAASAKERLDELGYYNVEVEYADGYFGWEEHAPFDAIMITAAVNHIPPPLIEQLKDEGILILPLGPTTYYQTLTLIEKKDGELRAEHITGVRFVPMTGEAQKGG